MQNPLILAGLALTTGVVIGILVQPDSDIPGVTAHLSEQDQTAVEPDLASSTSSSTDLTLDSLNAVERRLEREIKARKALEEKLAEMNRKLIALERNVQLPVDGNLAARAEDPDETGLPDPECPT